MPSECGVATEYERINYLCVHTHAHAQPYFSMSGCGNNSFQNYYFMFLTAKNGAQCKNLLNKQVV